jgi:hypothetical protein
LYDYSENSCDINKLAPILKDNIEKLMSIFYKPSDKELLNIRNKIVLETAIPLFIEKGFTKSPFSTAWFGGNNLNDFEYELCRLTANSQIEILSIYVARGDKWTQINLNIFEIQPTPKSIDELNNADGLQFCLPPNSLTKMRLRSDDIKGPPIFSSQYLTGHKLNRFFTKGGLNQSINRLTNIFKSDIENFDIFIKRWHELHKPLKTDWNGHQIK